MGLDDFSLARPAWVENLCERTRDGVRGTLPLRPTAWLALASVLLVVAHVRWGGSYRLETLLLTSSLLHYVSVLAIVSHYEFRWGHQSIHLALLALALLAGRALERRHPRRRPTAA